MRPSVLPKICPGLTRGNFNSWIGRFAFVIGLGWLCSLAATATAQTTVFSDSFSGTLSQWSYPASPVPSISNGQLQIPKSLEMMRSAPDSTAWNDYQFSVSATITATALGLIFRSPDNNDGYMWQLSSLNQAVRFHKKVNGTYTLLKSTAYAFAIGTTYQVVISTSGTSFSISINGVVVDTTTDATYSAGAVGFRTGSTETGYADNVVVTAAAVVTPPAPVAAPPGAPTGLVAGARWNVGNPLTALSWTAGTTGGTPTGYLIERRVTGASTYARLTGVNPAAAAFNDYWVQPNASYDYRLSAFNTYGSSGYATVTISVPAVVPLGYVGWAEALWPATGGALANGSLWTDTAGYGYPNSFAYAFAGNPAMGGAPGSLSVRRSSGQMQVWANSFAARTDVHYLLQGSPDLSNWTTYLDETSAAFSSVGNGPGTSAALLNVNPASPAAPTFFRWAISPNTSASTTPASLLVNGLPGTSGATLTQKAPGFSWQDGSSDTQTAYEILVASSAALLTESTADVWNSGKVTGSGSLSLPYGGLALQSNTTYYWTVRVWNGSGTASSFAAVQTFTTGTLTSTYKTDTGKVIQERIAPANVIQKGAGWYFIDFGNDAWGSAVLTVPSPVAGQVITVGMGEELSDVQTVDTTPDVDARYQSVSITMQSGVTSYAITPKLLSGTTIKSPTYIGNVMPFRYLEITNVPEPFSASQITQLAAHMPFNDSAATFNSSDALLNSIWALCKQTTKASTFLGIYVDGDRERKPYEADAYITMLNHDCMDGDYVTARYSHEYLLTNSTWPTEWLAHSIFMAYTDYLYTGDTRSLAANYTVLQGKLLSSRIRSDGLYTGTTSSGSGSQPTDIVDWPAGERNSYDMAMPVKTVTSAFHYQALVYMQQIATVLGKTADASTYQSAAALTLGSLNTELWDSTNLRYLDGMSSAGVVDGHSSLHSNLFPLEFGMVPAANRAQVISNVESPGMVCSCYGAQYLLEALYSTGTEGNYALSLFDSTAERSWYNMLQYNTLTQEAWDPSLKTNEDWNHIWGAAAGNIIPRWLMGVRPLTPGFGKMIIQPQPGTLAYASLTMPTPHGPVSVSVQTNTTADFSLCVNIPANTTAKVVLPTLGSASTTVYVDGAASTGTISGGTISVDNVTPGPHLFERVP